MNVVASCAACEVHDAFGGASGDGAALRDRWSALPSLLLWYQTVVASELHSGNAVKSLADDEVNNLCYYFINSFQYSNDFTLRFDRIFFV